MNDKDSLGDRMKGYEERHAQKFMPLLPVIARLDGRSFHNFTRGLERPYDKHLSATMIDTAAHLVAQTGARCGYTQSDEITLVWLSDTIGGEMFFDGKLQKMVSILAADCTLYFNRLVADRLPYKASARPMFDCRVFQVPAEYEAANCLIWREKDAVRNSISMAAHHYFSPAQCHKKSGSDMQEMLFRDRGINWNDYPAFFKRGTYIRKVTVESSKAFTEEELAKLPPKHHARVAPDRIVKSTRIEIRVEENFPPLATIANREDVILRGADPILKADLSNEHRTAGDPA